MIVHGLKPLGFSTETFFSFSGSEKLRNLHRRFVILMAEKNIPCLSFGENIKTPVGLHLPDIWMVPPESSSEFF